MTDPSPSKLMSVYRKADTITRDMRDRIIRGEYQPGGRLPTRDALTAIYGVSKVTVQRALDTLAQEGFVVPDGRRGTFVAENCPHLTHYALLFPKAFESGPCNQFWKALAHAAEQMEPAVKFTTIWGFESRAGFAQYDEILADVEANRVAGLIFANTPVNLRGTPLVDRPGVPRTAMMTKPLPGVPAVELDMIGFLDRALDELVALGRRRPAVLCAPMPGTRMQSLLVDGAAARGITLEETLIQSCSIVETHWAERLVMLLMDRPADRRPDSLLILDDNLLEPAAKGLQRTGLAVPDDVAIISQCNFPWPTPSCLPVTRIGFWIPDCLAACVANIDLQRHGKPVPEHQLISALHESELATETHTPQWIGEVTP